MKIVTELISAKNQEWEHYTLINDKGMEVSCLNYGGIITKMLVPDKNNTFENVVIGFRDLEDYLDNSGFFGALIGRVGGRIQDAQFELDGNTYTLPANDGDNHLHGGPEGFHQVVFDATPFEKDREVGITFTHTSPDGHAGYPGNVDMQITYTLDNDNQFSITYEGKSDQKTALTATNHSYFNLSGDLKKDIKEHQVTIDSSTFVELDEQLIPTGNKLDVADTVFDFRNGRAIADGITSDHPQNKVAGNGYDHYFILDNNQQDAVIVQEPDSGRELVVTTDQPGLVMYTSNNLDDSLDLTEGKSRKYVGLCLETQSSPASLHNEGFPSVVLDKDETYRSKTTFAFGLME